MEAFVVYMISFISKMAISLAQETLIALVLAKEITILEEDSDFPNVLLKKWAKVLLKCTKFQKLVIKL